MISLHVKISMISVASGLSLKLYLNSLVYHRNIFGSSSKVFGNLRQSSAIFGNSRKFSGNVRKRSSGLRDNFGKYSEIFGKSSKTPLSVRLYNKKNITRWTEDMNFMLLVARATSHSFAALTREILLLPLQHKIHIFSPPCNILYLFPRNLHLQIKLQLFMSTVYLFG